MTHSVPLTASRDNPTLKKQVWYNFYIYIYINQENDRWRLF